MSAAKHTPGPWKVYHSTDGRKIIGIGDQDGMGVADPFFGTWGDGDEQEANAVLIAAAPDLLAALKDITARFRRAAVLLGSDEEFVDLAVADALAAVAKAEGRQ